MRIEDQVCSLGLAMKLKELGVPQKSLFYWVKTGLNVITCEERWEIELLRHNLDKMPDYYVSAFSVAELGEMLPSCVSGYYWLKITNWNDYELVYIDDNYNVIAEQRDDNEANARAKMLIHLIEKSHVKAKDF